MKLITLEGLTDLLMKDVITGECDRHPENYYIAEDGTVIGIDEDCCFGVNAIPEKRDVREQKTIKGLVPNKGSLMLRMPPVVTIEMRDKVNRLWENKELLEIDLAPYISPPEIKATLVRLSKLKAHINSANCKIVDSNAGFIDGQNLGLMTTNNSYACREIRLLEKKHKNWNKLREHRNFPKLSEDFSEDTSSGEHEYRYYSFEPSGQ